MASKIIVECNRCGGLLLAEEDQKTRTCPYCGARIELTRAKKIASAKDAFEAAEILRDLKNKRKFPNRKK